MVQDIRVAVNELLTEVEWMDEATKHLAKDKVCIFPNRLVNRHVMNVEMILFYLGQTKTYIKSLIYSIFVNC
jgi:hypothetical protein